MKTGKRFSQYLLIFIFTVNYWKCSTCNLTGQSPNETPTSPKPTTKTPQLPHYKLTGAQIHPHYNTTTQTPPTTTANKKNSSEKLSYENYLNGWKRLGTTGEASTKDSANSVVFEGLLEGEIDFVDDPSLKGFLRILKSFFWARMESIIYACCWLVYIVTWYRKNQCYSFSIF